MLEDQPRRLTLLKWILAAGILSTAIHYTHNFIAVDQYPGPGGSFYTVVRVAIVIAWPLLTAIGLLGYRRYAEGRYAEAHVCLGVYAFTGLSTGGHFAYGSPRIPAFFYGTIVTDVLTGIAMLAFTLWSVSSAASRAQKAGA